MTTHRKYGETNPIVSERVKLIPSSGVRCLRYCYYDRDRKPHDDVIKWKHFPRYWPFVRGIHRSPVNSPHKGQWRGALMFSLICTRINGWVNNGDAGDLRRHRVHCDVTVMQIVSARFLLSKSIPWLVYSSYVKLRCCFERWFERVTADALTHCFTRPQEAMVLTV